MANDQATCVCESQEQLFIGIDEDDDWECETFGYFWPMTEENKRGIKRVLEAAKKMEDFYGYCPYQFSGPYTEAELAAIASASRNTYMSRAYIVEGETNWDDLVRRFEEGDNPLCRGTCLARSLRAPKRPQRNIDI